MNLSIISDDIISYLFRNNENKRKEVKNKNIVDNQNLLNNKVKEINIPIHAFLELVRIVKNIKEIKMNPYKYLDFALIPNFTKTNAIEKGIIKVKYDPAIFGLLKKPVTPVTHSSTKSPEQIGLWNQTIKLLRNTNGPYNLNQY
tara:strand:- start:350 stop:781 length:432 start_codon:yes stop_codon:yes gene_type:complete